MTIQEKIIEYIKSHDRKKVVRLYIPRVRDPSIKEIERLLNARGVKWISAKEAFRGVGILGKNADAIPETANEEKLL